jgi:purine-binding chemotaxis protein CheW
MPGLRPYCTFKVADLLFGIDVLDVHEVIRHREPTRVPTAPPFVPGLINLRGQIVTVIDLRGRFGLSPSLLIDSQVDVVVRAPGGAIGLVVDEVCNVIEVDETVLQRTPETIPEAVRRLISGRYLSAGRSLLVLEIAKVVE